MNASATQPLTLPEKVVDHVSCSHAALEKAAAELAAHEAVQQKVAALIEKAVSAMVSGERIDDVPAQREKLAAILKDPVQTLELLTKVAVHRNAAEHTLGVPVDQTTKTAGDNNGGSNGAYDSLTDPRVGVRTTREKTSSARLRRGLGLPPATED